MSSIQPAAETRGTTVLHDTINDRPQPLPARYFDTKTTEPISFFLSGLEELLAWQPNSNDDFNISAVPLAKRQPPLHSRRPRTLVCHDMRGGYLEDRFIQGSATRNPYVFYHWRYIDIFVYFSHHTVTIPPVVWTNAAHRNGVPVLGTFITEWTDGEKMCEAFLAGGEEAFGAVAEQLARIAQHYRFDGWLVNIENTLSAAAVGNLPPFLRDLTARVHSAVPGGLVIWYDSVLQDGTLRWQNELNEDNRVFFDACDGLFTNYNWKEKQLEHTLRLAGPRHADVYVGVDVFARGDVIGGGFDTDKSLRLIRQHSLSAAIFAPGWVYEHLGEENFLQNENRFWGLLAEYLPTHSICTLPLATSFSLGMGTSRFLDGKDEESGPWYDLSMQEIQPLYPEHQGRLSTSCCLQDAWCGGSSLRLQGTIPPGEERVAVRLFSLQMPAPPKLFLTLLYKLEGPQSDDFVVALEVTTWDSGTCLEGNPTSLPGEDPPNGRYHPRFLPAPPPGLAKLLAACHRGSHGWTSRCYELELQDCTLRDLSVIVSRQQPSPQETSFTCLLGEVRVLDTASVAASPPQVLSVTASQLWWQEGPEPEELSLSLTLRWSFPPGRARCFRVLSQGARCRRGQTAPQLLGLAQGCLFRAVGLPVPRPTPGQSCRLELLVEPVLRDELPVDPDRWGRLVLVYSSPGSGTSSDGH
ncbi:cytosolic endo-beta-N-acetylglucosaminidase [Manacus vitellinus]|uniref:cytosolic endo-beta-N-acetylglucosaminidase n=1 Tax=Manacus vitellinus TaxID=328815 RepID=UPI00115D186B|nr:cytosolic endo-beta-N-acetylglucosaminidase [Manacus vitellinus]